MQRTRRARWWACRARTTSALGSPAKRARQSARKVRTPSQLQARKDWPFTGRRDSMARTVTP